MNSIAAKAQSLARWETRVAALVCLVATTLWAGLAGAHSVGQVEVTKFLHPDTRDLLLTRAQTDPGNAGIKTGDVIRYVVSFHPIANGATIGGGGYVTDYIPPGTEVVGAAMLARAGELFVEVAPDLPGPIWDGWGPKGAHTWAGPPFDDASYDPTGRCQALFNAGTIATDECNGKMTDHYGDTGIFYSTDSRTAVVKDNVAGDTDGVITQAIDGLNIDPTAEGQLIDFVGDPATTHNLWDADQTNAFGTGGSGTDPINDPPDSDAIAINDDGRGNTPFMAGSVVAGPESGYPLDNTGSPGPWNRISYIGSRISCTPVCEPALDAGPAPGMDVSGAYTSFGWMLSESNPLPASTNAVRWAIGRLEVGENRYVGVDLKITDLAAFQLGGSVNDSEVFGGDSAQAGGKNGQDNTWRYNVPSVAESNVNLFLLKEVIGYRSIPGDNTSTIIALDGNAAQIPDGQQTLVYKISYLNTGGAVIRDLIITDTTPLGSVGGGSCAFIEQSAPPGESLLDTVPNRVAGCVPGIGGGASFDFNTLATLEVGEGGVLQFDMDINGTAGGKEESVEINQLEAVSAMDLPDGVRSSGVVSVSDIGKLLLEKTVDAASQRVNGVVNYTISVTNIGSANVDNPIIRDILPTAGGSDQKSQRFQYVPGFDAFSGLTSVAPTIYQPDPDAAATPTELAGPVTTPYTLLNSEEVVWDFTGQAIAPNATVTITFRAKIGADVPVRDLAYRNDVVTTYNGGVDSVADLPQAAPVVVIESPGMLWRPDRASTTVAGVPVVYTHQIDVLPGAGAGTLDFSFNSSESLTWLIYEDSDGDGVLSAADQIWTNGSAPNFVQQTFFVKSFVPGQTIPGWEDTTTFTATYNVGSDTFVQTVTDITKTSDSSAGAMISTKDVAASNCAGTVTGIFQRTQLDVEPNDCITYRIGFRNGGTGELSNIAVHDQTPNYTTYIGGSALFESTPVNLTEGAVSAPPDGSAGILEWTFNGTLAGGLSGSVIYEVRISP